MGQHGAWLLGKRKVQRYSLTIERTHQQGTCSRTAKQEGYKEGHGIEESIDGLDNMLEVYITLEQNNYQRLIDTLFHDNNPDKYVSAKEFHLAVTGGRDFTDKKAVFSTLDRVNRKRPITLLIHGGARGADTLASSWATSRKIPAKSFLC